MAPPAIHEVAAAIADGVPVDWNRWAPLSPLTVHGRIVERIARAHAALPPADSFSSSLSQSLLHVHPRDEDPGAETPVTWGPLVIVEKIGRGTYGEVYRARDPRLDRPVALKLLRRRERGDRGLESAVIEEGRLAARVRHPNVVTVYGAERIEGRVGVWMEFVDGQTLEDELRARGPLPAREVAAIGVDVCRGIEAVHRAGLLHRDVKAQNVMQDRTGRVVITDFGAGRELREGLPPGELVGTPLYLAPEVLHGAAATSQSDVYSVGVLLYHLCTGGFPAEANSLAELRDHHAAVRSVPARARVRAVPAALRGVVARAIDLDPSKRHASAADLASALEGVLAPPAWRRRPVQAAAAAMVTLIVAALASAWVGPSLPRGASSSPVGTDSLAELNAARRIVAVLPFENASGDRSRDYLAAGMAAQIHARLSTFGELHVVSRDAVPAQGSGDVERIAAELRAGSIITGAVRTDGDRAQVTVRLIDPRTRQALWAQDYVRSTHDVAALQSEVALRVADTLNIGISPDERRRVEKRPTASAEAYDLYLRAEMLPCGDANAVALFRKALALDARFAVARAALAYKLLCPANVDPEHVQLAIEHAREALRVDPQLAAAHGTLAAAYTVQGRVSDARIAFLRAIALDPNNVAAMRNLAELETAVGRFDEALLWAARAFPLSSSNASAYYHVGQPLVLLDDDEASGRWLAAGERRFPTNGRLQALFYVFDARRGETSAALDRGRRLAAVSPRGPAMSELSYAFATPEAEVENERYFRRWPDPRDFWLVPESARVRYADLLMRRGETVQADRLLDEAMATATKLLEQGNRLPRVHLEVAAVHALRGEREPALQWLEQAYDAGLRDARSLALDRTLVTLRRDPTFKALVARMEADVAAMRERATIPQTLPAPPTWPDPTRAAAPR